jgi:hypothetical protein
LSEVDNSVAPEPADDSALSPDGATASAAPEGAAVESAPFESAATPSAPASSALCQNAQRELARLAELPMAEHPDVYQGIHAELQAALAAIDDA